MKRRCEFLDNLPAFNYNTGVGEIMESDDGEKIRTDTRHLGSTLMKTMLSEVTNFCDSEIKKNWTDKPHQQVRLQVAGEGSAVPLLICSLSMTSAMVGEVLGCSPSDQTSSLTTLKPSSERSVSSCTQNCKPHPLTTTPTSCHFFQETVQERSPGHILSPSSVPQV